MRDVEQWLNHGWCLYHAPHGGMPAVVRYYGIEDAGRRRVAIGGSPPFDELIVQAEDLAAYWPTCGSLNVDDKYAVYLSRRPTRQYRRTYNSRVLDMKVPQRWHVMAQVGADLATPDSYEVAQAAFAPDYPSYGEALTMLGERPSVAITQHLIVAGEPNQHLLYVDGDPVGVIREGHFTPTISGRQALRLLKFFDGRVSL
jgi:hypothetical protein